MKVGEGFSGVSKIPDGFSDHFESRRSLWLILKGLGMVTPIGWGVETTWKRMMEAECGIKAMTTEDLKMNNFDREAQLHAFDQLTSKVAVIVPCGTNSGEFDEELWLNSKDHRSLGRFIAYALVPLMRSDAKWLPADREQKERMGVSIGGGIGSIGDIVDAAKVICEKEPNHAAVAACATGAHSAGDAARMIQLGDSDVMVAWGHRVQY